MDINLTLFTWAKEVRVRASVFACIKAVALLLAFSSNSYAIPSLSLGAAEAEIDSSFSASVNIVSAVESGGINLQVVLPAGVSVNGVSAGEVLTNAGAFIVDYSMQGQVLNVLAYSVADTFSADGELITLSLHVDNSVSASFAELGFVALNADPVINARHAVANADGSQSLAHSAANGALMFYSLVSDLGDADGMADSFEIAYGFDPYTDDSGLDLDGDGITNLEEFLLGTDPTEFDTLAAVKSDFSGDEIADILWRKNTDDQVKLVVNDSSALQLSVVLKAPRSSDWSYQQGDFNGDYRNDMLWRNNADDSVIIELSDNSGGVAQELILLSRGADWSSTIGDFNGDGHDDILWREPVSGVTEVAISAADGTLARVEALLPKFPAWQHQIGDFNGDGRDDILWRKPSIGDVKVALSDANGNQESVTSHYSKWDAWESTLGDFNGDRRTDILWRKVSAGTVKIALSGTSGEQASIANHYSKYAAWTHSIGDFTGDGLDDILWRKLSQGIVKVAVSDINGLQGSIANHYNKWDAWQHYIGDYNGDKRADILWRKPAQATVKIAVSDPNGLQGSVANHFDKSSDWELLQ